ncbi:hypothetical protein BDZ85DRAFT_279545 [Elsinoe ampelina]|uniref:Uncharacterized protein n=1 Tax=Elsinoe ampelina TaxID=302913 RepID=A0A6A6GJF4_9PEZI|nr:hypothetical protein BDZ85DRAFT_279545 [Elsinoe ampelina]
MESTHNSSDGQEYHPLQHLTSSGATGRNVTRDENQNLLPQRSDDTEIEHQDDHGTSSLDEWMPTPRNLSASSTRTLRPIEPARHPLRKPSRFRVRDWQWEFAASLFSLGCFAAVVGVLAANDQRPLSRWEFVFGITLNTFIAILSTLSRTALLVPVASGFSQLKWIHLMGPPRPLRDVQTFEDASRGPWGSFELIRRLHVGSKLATWGSLITILTLAMGPFAQQLLSYPARSVLNDGAVFYRSQIYDSQYGEYRTTRGPSEGLGSTMGSHMQDAILNGLFNLSTPKQFECPTTNCEWEEFASLAVRSICSNVTRDTQAGCVFSRGRQLCNYTTPAGFTLAAGSFESSGVGGRSYFNTTAFEAPLNGQQVLECEMQWSGRVTRNLTVVNGTFHPGTSEDFDLALIKGDYDMVGGSPRKWYTFNVTEATFSGNRTFTIDSIDLEGIQAFLYSVFTASRSSVFYLPLMNSTDRAATVASISDSMSYALGQSPSGTRVDGRAISSELYIRVEWPWIILPLAEVVMSVAFLACTLFHSHRKGAVAWKSSGIVPLLVGMIGWDSDKLMATSWRDLERRSESMRGRLLLDDSDHLAFHKTE